ncbi:hypothetical protein AB0D12_31700 [Streptomyces sp. NPDC048479]|uniref:hypothetical protein n=1 Tax=Streptomyces sp. NPDC048479 TaxID=3154725 RepID=UPI00342F2529
MRRPALYRPTPAHPGWARPYAGVPGMAVFYNGDPNPAPAPAPTPADLAARAGQQPPPAPAAHPDPLIDHDTGLAMTQDRFSKIMTRENTKGRNKLLRELAEAAGIPFDPDNFDVVKFGGMLKDAEQTRQAQLSEEQRRTEELAKREREADERIAAAEQREAEAAKRDRESRVRSALVRLGATGDDLDDATALMRLADDADDAAITTAAEALKARRAELFGGTAAPSPLPPAPSGAPAGAPPARTAPAGKNAVKEAARARAEAMGLRRKDDAA